MKAVLFSLLLFPLCLGAQVFKGESVEYDSLNNRFLTSDDGTSIVQRESNGTISYFGQGLVADYGMEIVGNTLFAISSGKIYGYDLTTETQVAAITISGAGFLNGLASDSNSLWVTDFNGSSISHVDISNLSSPVVTKIVPAYGGTPNGIVYDKANNRLVVASWGSNAAIKAVDLTNNSVSVLTTTSLSNIDGIDMDGQGNFFIASWSPDKIIAYSNDFSQSTEITVAGLNNPADICYALKTDTLAIPNTGGNNVLFVGFQNSTGIASVSPEIETLSLSPNPVTSFSHILLEAKNQGKGSFIITDIKGRTLYSSADFLLNAGKNELAFPEFTAPTGFYYCVFSVNRERKVVKFFWEG